MSEKSWLGYKTTSTGTLPPRPDWYMTYSEFVEVLADVLRDLPYVDQKTKMHPADISITVSMAADSVGATISALHHRGFLKYPAV